MVSRRVLNHQDSVGSYSLVETLGLVAHKPKGILDFYFRKVQRDLAHLEIRRKGNIQIRKLSKRLVYNFAVSRKVKAANHFLRKGLQLYRIRVGIFLTRL